MRLTLPAEGRRCWRQTRRTRSKKTRGAEGAARITPPEPSSSQEYLIFTQLQIYLMSGPRPPREALPGKRPAPVDPRTRRIGCVVGSDSFGTNEEIWHLFVRVGLIPEVPRCTVCHKALPTYKARRDLHFSLYCHTCQLTVNVMANTYLDGVRPIRKFLATLEGWCDGDKVASIRAKPASRRRRGSITVMSSTTSLRQHSKEQGRTTV